MCTNVHNIYDLMEMSSIIKSFDEVNEAVFHFLGTGQQIVYKKQAAAAAAGRAASMPQKEDTADDTKRTPTHGTAGKSTKRPVQIELVSESPFGSYRDEVLYPREHLLEKCIVRVILEKPYYSIRQITKALRRPEYGSIKKSRRKIKSELAKLGLENSEDRYEFALKNRPR
jgi:hypothetical protein